jgi:hypothetical protein
MTSKNKIPLILLGSGIIVVSISLFLKRRVIFHSRKYLGILEEGDNYGWNDPLFEQKLSSVGWKRGYQWCVYFVKAMWADVYPKLRKITVDNKSIIDYISGNSQTTFKNFVNLSRKTNFLEVNGFPKAGDIVVWQYHNSSGEPQSTGHVGLVISVKGDTFKTIEGNTSELGMPEETVSKKKHSIGEYSRKTGLKLKGFIHHKI